MRRSRDFNHPEEVSRPMRDGGEPASMARRILRVAALIAASLLLAAGAAFAALWGLRAQAGRLDSTLALVEMRAALNAGKNGVVGVWYETEGWGAVEFYRDGSFRFTSSYFTEVGTYSFDADTGAGEFGFDDGDTRPMTLENGLLDIDGFTFTTEYVEEQDDDWDAMFDFVG